MPQAVFGTYPANQDGDQLTGFEITGLDDLTVDEELATELTHHYGSLGPLNGCEFVVHSGKLYFRTGHHQPLTAVHGMHDAILRRNRVVRKLHLTVDGQRWQRSGKGNLFEVK